MNGLQPQVWTVEDIRYRLTEAADVLRRMPMPPRSRPAHVKAGWPDVVYEWSAYGYTAAVVRPAIPTAEEISRLDETLGWLHWLTRPQRMILWARAQGWTWRKIEELDGRQERQLRTVAGDAVHRILARLNGTPGRMVVDPNILGSAGQKNLLPELPEKCKGFPQRWANAPSPQNQD